jgi:outer membrane protein W
MGIWLLSSAGTASAQEKKVQIGLRVGYALVAGKASSDSDSLSNSISGQIPIGLDAGYLVLPHLLVGLYGQYGVALVKKCDPDPGASCSGHDLRFGVQGQYHFSPNESTDPWLGLGVGYESLVVTESRPNVTHPITWNGWELVNLQGGADFKVSDRMTLGPFLSVSFDQFSTVKADNLSFDLEQKALHEWIILGAKGSFGL